MRFDPDRTPDPLNLADPGHCPAHLRESLDAYAEHGVPVGSFLEAVLANDLMDACGRADATNAMLIQPIASYVYNHMPSTCHGSREIYAGWIARHAAERARRREADRSGP